MKTFSYILISILVFLILFSIIQYDDSTEELLKVSFFYLFGISGIILFLDILFEPLVEAMLNLHMFHEWEYELLKNPNTEEVVVVKMCSHCSKEEGMNKQTRKWQDLESLQKSYIDNGVWIREADHINKRLYQRKIKIFGYPEL